MTFPNNPLTPDQYRELSPFWRARPMHALRLLTIKANGGSL